MSASDYTKLAVSAPVTTDAQAALCSAAKTLLLQLTTRLTNRPHGEISRGELPEVFVITSQLEQLIEIERKKLKRQETIIQMALEREEEGSKLSKKRTKLTALQIAAMRQIVEEEFEAKMIDPQRQIASLQDQARRNEKQLDSSINDVKRLTDEVSFLRADANKAARVHHIPSATGNMDGRLSAAEKRLDKCDTINDTRHLELSAQVSQLENQASQLYEYNGAQSRNHDVLKDKLHKIWNHIVDQREGVEDLRDQADTTHARLESVVKVVDKNAGRVDYSLQKLYKRFTWLERYLKLEALWSLWDPEYDGLARV